MEKRLQQPPDYINQLLDDISFIKKKLEPIVPQNGFYTSAQVKQLLQIDDSILTSMRDKKIIQFLQLSDRTFRYKSDQPLLQGVQPIIKPEPKSKPRSSRLKRLLTN